MKTITKRYRNLPAAHRQPNHDGHCRLVHGHNWGFDITLSCETLEENGFVLDVGKMKPVRRMLEHYFDHTCLINRSDPKIGFFMQMHEDKLLDVRVVENCGMEGLAEMVFEQVQTVLKADYPEDFGVRGLRVIGVTCWEDEKNAATYTP